MPTLFLFTTDVSRILGVGEYRESRKFTSTMAGGSALCGGDKSLISFSTAALAPGNLIATLGGSLEGPNESTMSSFNQGVSDSLAFSILLVRILKSVNRVTK